MSHKYTNPTSSSPHSCFTIPLTLILLEFLYPWLLVPNTGKLLDKISCPTLVSFIVFSRLQYFFTIAVVPSLSVLFVPMATSRVPKFPRPIIRYTLSVTCSILAPGKQTTMSSCQSVWPYSDKPCSLYLSRVL